jgi:hypothetical protein
MKATMTSQFMTFSIAITGDYVINAQTLLAAAISNYTGSDYQTTLTSVTWSPSVYLVSGLTNYSSLISRFTTSNQYSNFVAGLRAPSAQGQLIPYVQNDFQQTIGATIGIVVGVVIVLGLLGVSAYFIYKKRIRNLMRTPKKRVVVVKPARKVHAFEPIETNTVREVELVENEYFKKINDTPIVLRPKKSVQRLPSIRLTAGELNSYAATPIASFAPTPRAPIVRPPKMFIPPPPPTEAISKPVLMRLSSFSSPSLPISKGLVSQRSALFEKNRKVFSPLQMHKVLPDIKPASP